MALHLLHTVRRIEKELGAVLAIEPWWWIMSLANFEIVLQHLAADGRPWEPLLLVYLAAPYAGALAGVLAKAFCSVQVGRRRVWSVALGGFLFLVVLTDGCAFWSRLPVPYGLAALIAGALGFLVGVGAYEAREVDDSELFAPVFDLSKLTGRPAAEAEKPRKRVELRTFCARLFLFMVLTAALAGVSLVLAQKMSRASHDEAIIVFLVLFLLFAAAAVFSLVILARNITVSDIPTLFGRDDADDSEHKDR